MGALSATDSLLTEDKSQREWETGSGAIACNSSKTRRQQLTARSDRPPNIAQDSVTQVGEPTSQPGN